jgi:hypothetical protein
MQLSVAMCAMDGDALPAFGVTKAGLFSDMFGPLVRDGVLHGVSAASWRRKDGLLNILERYKE